MKAGPTFAVGDTCRVRGMRGVYRIRALHMVRGEVDLAGGIDGRPMFRTVTADRLMPARRGDTVPRWPDECRPPASRKAAR